MIDVGIVDIAGLSEEQYQQLYNLASEERRRRADRCLRREDAHRCIAADGALRYMLRHTLGTDQLPFAQTPSGKPFLPGTLDLHFNLSHSGRWVAIAWSDQPVGIDVETVRMDRCKEGLARRFYHREEQAYLFQSPDWQCRFFEIWTKKESYLKYLGTGIDRALNSFSVFDLPSVNFHTQQLEDAVLTLCAAEIECQNIPLTPKMLLSD